MTGDKVEEFTHLDFEQFLIVVQAEIKKKEKRF